MTSITTLLAPLDIKENNRLDEHQIAKYIDEHIRLSNGDVDKTIHWEKAAFEFCPNYKNKETGWGTYFGPMYIWPDEAGQSREYPSIQMLSEKVLEYYTQRADTSQNPILIARYAGLVYDFYKRITEKRTPYTITQKYIRAFVDTANGNYHSTPIHTVEKLKRALTISLLHNNPELTQASKHAIIAFENRHAQDHLPGLWGYSFQQLLLKNRTKKIVSDTEELMLVTEMENRFSRLLKSADDKHAAFRNLEFAGTYLAKYYRLTGDKAKLTYYVQTLVAAIDDTVKSIRSSTKAGAEYDRIYNICNDFGFMALANCYLKKIRELGRASHDEMASFKYEQSESKENLEKFVALLLKGSAQAKIERIAHSFLPTFKAIENLLKEDFKVNAIKYIITQKLLDRKGRVKAVIGPLDNDLEGHVFYAAANNMKIKAALYLNYVFKKIRENMEITPLDIITALTGSPVVSPSRLKVIDAGIQAYLKEDYLVSIHLLVPQIEEALRNTLEINGGVVLNYNEDGSSFVKTLDTILRDDVMINVLGPDFCNYFRLLLTDQRGWNLRNDVCHGLAEPEEFSIVVAERIIHAIFCIANIKFTPAE